MSWRQTTLQSKLLVLQRTACKSSTIPSCTNLLQSVSSQKKNASLSTWVARLHLPILQVVLQGLALDSFRLTHRLLSTATKMGPKMLHHHHRLRKPHLHSRRRAKSQEVFL